MERVSGKPHALDIDTFRCAYLQEGRCTIYNDRPLVCRLWGAAENLICPFGCKPDRYLTEAEAVDLMQRMGDLGGDMRSPGLLQGWTPGDECRAPGCADADAPSVMKGSAIRSIGTPLSPTSLCPECHWHGQAQQGSTLDSWIGQTCPKCKTGILRLVLLAK